MGSVTVEDWREECHRRQEAAAGAGAGVAVPEHATPIEGSAAESEETEEEAEEEAEEAEDDDADVGAFSREAEEANLAYSRTRTELINARRALQSVRTQMSRLLDRPRSFHEESWTAFIPCHERLMAAEKAAVQAFEEAYFRLSTVHGMRARASTLLEALDDIWSEL